MCRRATCDICQKTSWLGCGSHIQSVIDSVPQEDRCSCVPKVELKGKEYPPKAGTGKAQDA